MMFLIMNYGFLN